LKKKKLKNNRQWLEVLPGEGRRFSFRNFKQALVFYVLLLAALIVVVQIGYHWMGDQFLAWRLQVVEAEQGVMQQQTTAEGIITRSEQVIKAPSEGIVLSLAAAGERVSTGNAVATIGVLSAGDLEALRGSEEQEPDADLLEKVLDYWQEILPFMDEKVEISEEAADEEIIEQETTEVENDNGLQVKEQIDLHDEKVFEELIVIYNERAGFVSHYFDGLERHEDPLYLSGDNIDEFSPEGFFIVEGDLVEAGDPVIKIVDNWSYYFSIILGLHPGRIVAAHDKIEIKFNFAPGQTVSARRYDYEIDEEKQEVRIAYLIEKQLPGFDQVRQTEASLLYRRRQGIIVPAEAIFEKDHGQGVYLNRDGRVIFQPVTVIDRQEEKVMVEGIAPYSLVISRPELVEEGQRLN